ncbi:hypothetical protein L596_027249 [Steinernema carpocapsae]|uniref:Uncharacterized protein n=1 Tax=Steinernema carpocapsae TaxID=34508 RepID=A0A4U5M3Q7_STECR|nr:hypothetical protein L596_027249 [Steinernema carpocapsae]
MVWSRTANSGAGGRRRQRGSARRRRRGKKPSCDPWKRPAPCESDETTTASAGAARGQMRIGRRCFDVLVCCI